METTENTYFVTHCLNTINNLDIHKRLSDSFALGCSGFVVFNDPLFRIISNEQRQQILDAAREKINTCEPNEFNLNMFSNNNWIVISCDSKDDYSIYEL